MKYRFAAITGASSGIGKAIALKLAREGVSVAIFSRNMEKLEKVVAEINSASPGVKVFPFSGDVQDNTSLESFVDECERAVGPLDIFVNNAGIAHGGTLASLSPSQVDDLVKTNFCGSVWSIYYAMKLFEKRQRGALVNIASTTTLKPSPNVALYAATKAGVASLIQSLEEQHLNNRHIKILNIVLGSTLTGFFSEIKESLIKENMIVPENIADGIWWALNHPENCKISSIVLRNNGDFSKTPVNES